MKITLQTPEDAQEAARALAEYIEKTLDQLGYLHPQAKEPRDYYAIRRELMKALKNYV